MDIIPVACYWFLLKFEYKRPKKISERSFGGHGNIAVPQGCGGICNGKVLQWYEGCNTKGLNSPTRKSRSWCKRELSKILWISAVTFK